MNSTKVKRRVGDYELGRTIGEGTFAKVKFARNTKTGEAVAIKILDKEKVLKHKLVEQVSFLFLYNQRKSLICTLISLHIGYIVEDIPRLILEEFFLR